MFIAGDTAHIHSPFGGQGMNTDCTISGTLSGNSTSSCAAVATKVLNSYTAERRPVIKRVIETTDFLTKTMGTPSKLAQHLRNIVIPMVSHSAVSTCLCAATL